MWGKMETIKKISKKSIKIAKTKIIVQIIKEINNITIQETIKNTIKIGINKEMNKIKMMIKIHQVETVKINKTIKVKK